MNGLGQHLARTGRPDEAETLIRRSLEIRRRLGDRGYAYAESLLDLGKIAASKKRYAEAEALDREGVALLKNFVEPDDARLVDAAQQLDAVKRAAR